MRVIAKKALEPFWARFPKAEGALKAWYQEVEGADWNTSDDVKKKYGNASIINSERVVFNICGNDYRLVVSIKYKWKIVYIRFVGTHAEYDKIDAETI